MWLPVTFSLYNLQLQCMLYAINEYVKFSNNQHGSWNWFLILKSTKSHALIRITIKLTCLLLTYSTIVIKGAPLLSPTRDGAHSTDGPPIIIKFIKHCTVPTHSHKFNPMQKETHLIKFEKLTVSCFKIMQSSTEFYGISKNCRIVVNRWVIFAKMRFAGNRRHLVTCPNDLALYSTINSFQLVNSSHVS